MHCYQTQPEGKHNGTSNCLSHAHASWYTRKYKHMQVDARSLSLSHAQKHIRQGAAPRTAAQLGSRTVEAALQWRSSQTPDWRRNTANRTEGQTGLPTHCRHWQHDRLLSLNLKNVADNFTNMQGSVWVLYVLRVFIFNRWLALCNTFKLYFIVVVCRYVKAKIHRTGYECWN